VTLFLGGPRHGQDNRVSPERQSPLEIATARPRTLPPSYLDIATASTYYLRDITCTVPHPPLTDKTYVCQVYVHETVTPEAAFQMLPDAVLRRWFETEGTLQPTQTPPERRETVTP